MIEHDDFFVVPYVDVENIVETLKSLKRTYHSDGDDLYFECPSLDNKSKCTCGLEETNKRIDAILEIFKK